MLYLEREGPLSIFEPVSCTYGATAAEETLQERVIMVHCWYKNAHNNTLVDLECLV